MLAKVEEMAAEKQANCQLQLTKIYPIIPKLIPLAIPKEDVYHGVNFTLSILFNLELKT